MWGGDILYLKETFGDRLYLKMPSNIRFKCGITLTRCTDNQCNLLNKYSKPNVCSLFIVSLLRKNLLAMSARDSVNRLKWLYMVPGCLTTSCCTYIQIWYLTKDMLLFVYVLHIPLC